MFENEKPVEKERKFQTLINEFHEENNFRKNQLARLSKKILELTGKQIPLSDTCASNDGEPKMPSVIDSLNGNLLQVRADNSWLANLVADLDELL